MTLKFSCFVTGTDTDVGKTLVATALLHKCVERGWRSIGMKPVAAGGAQVAAGQWRNADVDALMAVANVTAALEDINPYCFPEAIAPHLAAAHAGRRIEPECILDSFHRLQARAEAIVVEGAGGFLIPLNERNDSAALVSMLELPVVLVVGMRLGCLNHALLTQEAILARGLSLVGWVANVIDPQMAGLEDNLATLQARLSAPLLGVVPWLDHPDPLRVAACLSLPADGAVVLAKSGNVRNDRQGNGRQKQ